MEHSLVTDIALCIIAAWLVAVVSQALRQPLLLAYLVAGFLIGPQMLGWVKDKDSIATISEIGLSLLLFMIGLEIDLKKMLSAGRVITITAAVQILACIGLGGFIFSVVGPAQTRMEALYLAVAAAMSSTIIIVKILYEKRELETLVGRVTLGVLVLQDVFVILFLALQPNLKHPEIRAILAALSHVLLLVAVASLASRFILPPVFRFIARLPELVLVGSLAWCFAMAGFAGWLGLSTAMGALIAGTMVSTFPYTLDVAAKVTSLRDFFVTLFFVGLGMKIPLPTFGAVLWALFLVVILVATRMATVFPALYRMRQGFRVSLLTAINLSQMSELSLVLLALGNRCGDVSDQSIAVAAFAFAFLSVGSTYAILNNDRWLRRLTPWLKKLELLDLDQAAPESAASGQPKRLCLLGFSWTASSLLEDISRERPDLLDEIVVVDFNPVVHEKLKQRHIHALYGDITAREVLVHAGVAQARVILCSLPNTVLKGADNFKILRQLRELNPAAQIIVHAELLSDVPALYQAGASYVTTPRLLEAADLLQVVVAAEQNLLDQKRQQQQNRAAGRAEVIP